MLLLDALYINNSGGKVLLDLLIEALYQNKKEVYYLLDDRCEGQYEFLPKESTLYLKANIKSRAKFYKQRGNDFTKVLCFGNIPPTQRLKAQVFTYFHNINLLVQPASIPLKSRILLKVKSQYIQWLKNNTDAWLVQSGNMQDVMSQSFRIPQSKIEIYPFYRQTTSIRLIRPANTFFYISNGNAHKNHETLLDAWEILFAEGKDFNLALTVTDTYPTLQNRIKDMKSRGIKIENHGWVQPESLYKANKYLVYPSLAESFGLGLVEATEAGCEVIGADLPYTFSVVKPIATFNPLSSKSISQTVTQVFLANNGDTQTTAVVVKNRITDLLQLLS